MRVGVPASAAYPHCTPLILRTYLIVILIYLVNDGRKSSVSVCEIQQLHYLFMKCVAKTYKTDYHAVNCPDSRGDFVRTAEKRATLYFGQM